MCSGGGFVNLADCRANSPKFAAYLFGTTALFYCHLSGQSIASGRFMAAGNASTGRIGSRGDGAEVPHGGPLTFSLVISNIKERFLHRLAVLGFDLAILIVMTVLLFGCVLGLGGHIRLYQATVLLPTGCMLLSLVIRVRSDAGDWRSHIKHTLRDWIPFLFIVFIYENLHDVAGQVTDFDFAKTLNAWDIALFGVEPTLWAQGIYSPLATDLFAISYALYFALPLGIMFLLSMWERRFDFRHMALCLTLTFIMGFIGYVFLPASPPRYFIESLYTDPVRLHGLFLFDRLQGAWDGLSVISGGAFPSLHVGLSAVALIYAFRFRRINGVFTVIWYSYIFLVTSLWFSTVYLRHHWVMDIVAGWIVALVAYYAAGPMMRAWVALRRKYDLPF